MKNCRPLSVSHVCLWRTCKLSDSRSVLMRSRATNAVISGSIVVDWLVRDHQTSLTRFHVLWLPEVFLCGVHVLLESAQVSFIVLQLPPPVQKHAC